MNRKKERTAYQTIKDRVIRIKPNDPHERPVQVDSRTIVYANVNISKEEVIDNWRKKQATKTT